MEHTHSCEETAAHARCFGDDELMDSALPSLSELAFDFEGPEMHLHCCESLLHVAPHVVIHILAGATPPPSALGGGR
ncbi:hypothetical protein T484DRAFT_1918421 [Baffinella frigidus]|nr:hypothetical protein T484DRAFT_1918421 [Cryptophyta sp. CCMP2293]